MMAPRSFTVVLIWTIGLVSAAWGGQEKVPDGGNAVPLLRLETDGPTSLVTALGFRPDGGALYEAGFDKVVRAWVLDQRTGRFALDSRATLRVPIGPALGGAINALAVSSDGRWVAVAGNGVLPGEAGFRESGLVVPRQGLSDEDRQAQGEIFVFDTQAVPVQVRRLRGHRGPVFALAMPPGAGGRPVLASIATELETQGVLRLWDISTGEALGRRVGGSQMVRPGLAVWRSGEGPRSYRVAATWGEPENSRWLLWDFAAPEATPLETPDNPYNLALARLARLGQIVTGGFNTRTNVGEVRFWDEAQAGPSARPVRVVPLSLQGMGGGFAPSCLPQAIAPASKRPGGAIDCLAVVVQDVRAGAVDYGYALLLIDLDPQRAGAVLARVPLWRGPKIQPTLATVEDGKFLAVSGNQERQISVFAIADLLQGRAAPQSLKNSGIAFQDVAFTRKGETWGLALSSRPRVAPNAPPRPPAVGDLIFDISQHRLTTDLADWSVSAPVLDGWDAGAIAPRVDARGQEVPGWIYVRQAGKAPTWIRLPVRAQATAVTLLPPGATRKVPLIAVGLTEPGVGPSLWLYHATTGRRLRQLSGHSGPVLGLAFGADGRWLASAASDQTVAVWNLRDLDEVLDRQGQLSGIALAQRDGRFVVARVEADSPYRVGELLREGDVLRGLMEAGALRTPDSVAEFHRELARRAPGQTVTLRRSRPGSPEADVSLRLGQATDERKPLFWLFVNHGVAPGQRGWVGWSPLGPYDLSGPEMEQRFGWHFNTEQAEVPTRFALAAEYRVFHRPGVLKDLFDLGRLPPPEPPKPLDPPAMSLLVQPDGEIDGLGQLAVRSPLASVRVLVTANLPEPEQIERVEWRLDDEAPRPMRSIGPGLWDADLENLNLIRGTRHLTATLHTREAAPQAFSVTQTLRIQPEPPIIETETKERTVDVEQPDFTFRARVVPTHPTIVRLVGRGEAGIVLEKRWEIDRPLAIEEPIKLSPGVTTYRCEAVHRDALPGHEAAETSVLGPITVTYRKLPARPPVLNLTGFVPLDATGAEVGPREVLEGDREVILSTPKVRVEGTITAEEPLSAAERLLGEGPNPSLAGFEPGRAATFAIREVVKLVPGRQEFRLRSRAGDGEWRDASLALEYRPPVPRIARVDVEPVESRQVELVPRLRQLIARTSTASPQVRVRVTIDQGRAEAVLDSAVLVVNGEESVEAMSPEGGAVLGSVVSLRPGSNTIQVRLRNHWGTTRTIEPIEVSWLRPPRIVSLEAAQLGERPFIQIGARVASPIPLTRAQVEITTLDTEGETAIRAVDLDMVREGDAWRVSAAQVPVDPGSAEVRVGAWNAEGRSTASQAVRLLIRKPKPPPPLVEFVRPVQNETSQQDRAAVVFRVRSTTPLARVALLRVTSPTDRTEIAEFDTAQAVPGPGGVLELVAAQDEVELQRGPNHLQAVAVNEGGEARETRVLSYVAPPIEIVIDRLDSARPRDEPIPTVVDTESGRLVAQSAIPNGRARIHGRVLCLNPALRAEVVEESVQIWVNGFPQVLTPVQATAQRPREAEFEAEIVLGRPTNTIAARLPRLSRLAHDLGERSQLNVTCETPITDQNLHLLILSMEPVDERELVTRALQALRARRLPGRGDRFETPAFSRGTIHGPSVGKPLPRCIGLLHEIGEEIGLGRQPSNDVVVVYYQGEETLVDGQVHLWLRPESTRTQRDLIAVDRIVSLLSATRGAKLFLLDVARSGDRRDDRLALASLWPEGETEFGLLRFLWRGETGDRPAERTIPENARLISALRDVLPGSPKLRDVAEQLENRVGELERRYPGLAFIPLLSDPLKELIVGAPRD
jgi:hypothetical protein